VGTVIRLQVSTNESFTDLVVDEDVTGHDVFARDGFPPSITYCVRVTADGAQSNRLQFHRDLKSD